MSTPWPIVTANATVGRARLCDDAADLRRSFSGADTIYRGSHLDDVRHLTMQRWVKVQAGRKPMFSVSIVLPHDVCSSGDGRGHCVKHADRTSSRTTEVGTNGR